MALLTEAKPPRLSLGLLSKSNDKPTHNKASAEAMFPVEKLSRHSSGRNRRLSSHQPCGTLGNLELGEQL